jgi:hypothetical protein
MVLFSIYVPQINNILKMYYHILNDLLNQLISPASLRLILMLFPSLFRFPSGRLPRNFPTEKKIVALSYTFSFPQSFTIPVRVRLPDFTVVTILVEGGTR